MLCIWGPTSDPLGLNKDLAFKRVGENRKETADLSTALRSGRDDKFVGP
jgi:hypothetical protein